MSTQTIQQDKNKLQKPRKWCVIFHNDDFTPTVFVVNVLQNLYRKTEQEANILCKEIHTKGSALVGVYTYEIAETKVKHTERLASQEGHPLLTTMEPEE